MVSIMANPQPKPYIQMSSELFDAIIRYRIPGEQRQVFDFIIRKTYGFHKKQDAISLSQFVEATGMKKPAIVRAIKGLLSKKIICVIKKDNYLTHVYGIIKDYDKWEPLTKKITLTKKIMAVDKKDNESLSFLSTTKEKKDNTTKERKIYIDIFDFWNSAKIVVHKEKHFKIHEPAIKKAYKLYEIEDILDAICNYKEVYNSELHYFSHKWTLIDFLNRGLSKFVNESDPLNNFKKGSTSTPPPSQTYQDL